MGSYSEHIDQSKKNFKFLSGISTSINDCWDWQVTTCFYTALHLINAHIVAKTGGNYLTHKQVDEIIRPYNEMSLGKLSEEIYLSYNKLFHLSRRSRYLLSENNTESKGSLITASFTNGKHLRKAIHHLDNIISFINSEYNEDFALTEIKCLHLKGRTFKFFKIVA